MSSSDQLPSLTELRLQRARRQRPTPRSRPAEDAPLFAGLADSLFPAPESPESPPIPAPAVTHLPPAPSGVTTVASAARASQPPHLPAAAQPRPAQPQPAQTAPRIWTVTALVRQVRGLVENAFSAQVTIEGEISNWRPAGSGHSYFTLKDGTSQLAVVLFRAEAARLRFKPKDGDAVRLRGQLSVYENRGQMQLVASSMELAGLGAQLAAVQELKARLRREGLFDRKRPLPAFPRCIGVITSAQGAALRDIVKVCRRRHAAVNLLLYPAAVQGPRCAAEVAAGLRWFSAHPDRADVVLVARGGGSWEDLHGFDDEALVRAIADCALPVIVGVGHATDSTLADSAADVCAPTPSAAAELVTAAQHRVEEHLHRLRTRVLRAGSYELLRARQRLSRLGSEGVLRRVQEALRSRAQRVDELGFHLEAAASRALRLRQERLTRLRTRLDARSLERQLPAVSRQLDALTARLRAAAPASLRHRRAVLESLDSQLIALSPLRVLDRGYALVYAADGTLLRSADQAGPGDLVRARLARGELHARVESAESRQA